MEKQEKQMYAITAKYLSAKSKKKEQKEWNHEQRKLNTVIAQFFSERNYKTVKHINPPLNDFADAEKPVRTRINQFLFVRPYTTGKRLKQPKAGKEQTCESMQIKNSAFF